MESDYQEEFPPISFTTFKALSKDNHEPSGVVSTEMSQEMHARATDVTFHNNHSFNDHHHKEMPRKLDGSLKEQTHQWFQNTQRAQMVKQGQFPDWFHGFLTRRRAEEILQDKPLGCFLVRFCESRVGYVLSYRGSERCRHFMLDQLGNGQYVIEGEKIAHSHLEDLVTHYRSYPVEPYNELLTTACVMVRTKLSPGDPLKSLCEAPGEVKTYSSIYKPARSPTEKKPTLTTSLEGKKSLLSEGKIKVEQIMHPFFKNTSEIHEKESRKYSDPEDLAHAYKPTKMASGSDMHSLMEICPPEKDYATMEEFHTYADPTPCGRRARDVFHEADETIAFYAIGRGSCKDNHDNVYSEVDNRSAGSDRFGAKMCREEVSSTLPHPAKRVPQNKATSFHSSLRMKKYLTPSSQERYKSPGKAAKFFLSSQPKLNTQFDDPAYGYSASCGGDQGSQDDRLEVENIYERIPECLQAKK
ncbi:SH2 domain-containing protein 2A [Spea bombifrons]|uniref:SH2 domain-containing protein 2A n=1 Tax=Spea bombifrons TaxID=233779 RepID=UPI00234A71BC|nr:SH2 domain-containing protein 2A [Spea bombifrons]